MSDPRSRLHDYLDHILVAIEKEKGVRSLLLHK